MDAFEGVHAFVEQERSVVHQHVDELHKLFAGPGKRIKKAIKRGSNKQAGQTDGLDTGGRKKTLQTLSQSKYNVEDSF